MQLLGVAVGLPVALLAPLPPLLSSMQNSAVRDAGWCPCMTVPCLCGAGGKGICREWGYVPGCPQCRVQGGWLLRPSGGEMSGSFAFAPCLDESAGCGEGAGRLLALISMLFK